MQVKQEIFNVQSNVHSTPCTIEPTPELFDNLIATTYKDRTMAPVRELSANAVDAHKLNGNAQVPFVVHAPNKLEPYFSVRDFGPGMSHEKMMEVYRKIGKSDKTHTNDMIGYMGIGSKSPFAYVDNYVVVSRQGGKQTQYVCFRNATRIPCISDPEFSETDEQDGLEVILPVHSWDCEEFATKIKQAFRFYKTKPVVKGIANFEHMTSSYLIKNEEYGITSSREQSLVIMGNIAYPISVLDFVKKTAQGREVSESEDTEEGAVYLNSKEKKLIKYGIHLFVPIGSVALAPSREFLTYTNEVRAFIKSVVAKAVAATEAEAHKAMRDAKTVWEARKLFGKVKNGVIGQICDFENTNFIEWNNRKISNSIIVADYIGARVEVLSVKDDDETSHSRKRRRKANPDSKSSNGLERWHIQTFSAEDQKVIFVNDLNRGAYAAAQRYMIEHELETALMLSGDTDEFIEQVGCQDLLVYASSLPKPERKKRNSASNDRSLLQEWSASGFSNVEVDLSLGGIYVEVRRDKIKRPVRFKSETYEFRDSNCIKEMVIAMRQLGFNEPVYAIRPCDMARLKKYQDEWVTLDQAFEDAVRRNSYLVDAARAKTTVCNLYELHKSITCLKDLDLDDDSLLMQAIESIEEVIELSKSQDANEFVRLNNYVKLFEINAFGEPQNKLNEVFARYPLLESVSYSCNKKAIEQYVKLIDESQKKNLISAVA